MGLPSNTEFTFRGKNQSFLKRTSAIAASFDSLFSVVDRLKLGDSYRGLSRVCVIEEKEHGMDIANFDPKEDSINLYPMAWSLGDRIDIPFFTSLGIRHWLKNLSQEQRVTWIRKAVLPDQGFINQLLKYLETLRFQDVPGRFKSPEQRMLVTAFLDILESVGISHDNISQHDLTRHPATSDFIQRKKPYSLKPLISQYGGGRLNVGKYEGAFASYCSHNGKIALADSTASERITALFKFVSY